MEPIQPSQVNSPTETEKTCTTFSNHQRQLTTQASTQQLMNDATFQCTPARKCLIIHARELPKQTMVWVQGTVVGITDPLATLQTSHQTTKTQPETQAQHQPFSTQAPTSISPQQYELAVDDGSAIARVQVNPKRDPALSLQRLRLGSYVLAVGTMCAKLKGTRMGMKAFVVRDLSVNGGILQTLWNLEVVDSYLYHHSQKQT